MTQAQLLSPAIRSQLSDFIAAMIAEADLPPLTQGDDTLFLQLLPEGIVDAFWEAYLSQLGDVARAQLLEANEDETGQKIWKWLQGYADFEKNEGARLLAQEIMEDFGKNLPRIIADAHARFRSEEELDLSLQT